MSIKLKALGLGLLAMLAVSAFAAVNAGANITGHFITGSEHTYVTGIQDPGTTDTVHFIADTGGKKIGCDKAIYTGTHKTEPLAPPNTTTELTITPEWDQCYTTPNEGESAEAKWNVDENGCDLIFRSVKEPETNDATVYVKCPENAAIVITHPNCTITVDTQTVGGAIGNGVTYTNKNDGNPWITMDVKVKLNTTYHGGICIFLGTPHTATMEGAVTVTGFSNPQHTIRTGVSAT
jgi:hypothetical protein